MSLVQAIGFLNVPLEFSQVSLLNERVFFKEQWTACSFFSMKVASKEFLLTSVCS